MIHAVLLRRSRPLGVALVLLAAASSAGCPSKVGAPPSTGDAPAAGAKPLAFVQTTTYGADSGFFLSVAFSPDGKLLAAGDTNGELRIWVRHTGEERRMLSAHAGLLADLAWSPDGRTIATAGGADPKARLWDVATGTTRGVLEGHGGPVRSVAYSPDGKRLATGSDDRLVWLWDPRTRKGTKTLAGHTAAVTDLRFAPDGSRLASASADRTVRIWDLDTGQATRVREGFRDGVSSVAFHPDGGRLVADSGSDAVLFPASPGGEERTFPGESLPEAKVAGRTVIGVAFGLGGRVVVTVHKGGAVHAWDADAGTRPVLLGQDSAFAVMPDFSPDGKTLAVAGRDGVRLWVVAPGEGR